MTTRSLPDHIGPYRVTGHLGSGGMGEVLRGHDDRLDRPVALKRIRPDARQPEKALQRFRREARALARLSHPAIVQVFDWVETAGQHWLVMELVDGRTLAEVLADGPLPKAEAIAIARELASGLAAVHEVGIVHRDLKPSNIIWVAAPGRAAPGRAAPGRAAPGRAAPGRAKILDFGLSKDIGIPDADRSERESSLTSEGQVLGTVRAMSPEQALGRKVDHRSDLFSFGVLLYEMLTGRSPFKGSSSVETLTLICSAKEEPLHLLDPEIPEELSRLVGQMLEKEPSLRPSGADWVAAEIARWSGQSCAEPTELEESLYQGTTLLGETLVQPPRDRGTPKDLKAAAEQPLTPRRRGIFAAVVGVAAGLWWTVSWVHDADRSGAGPARLTSAMTDFSTGYAKAKGLLERFDQSGSLDKSIEAFTGLVVRFPESAAAHAGLAQALWRKHWVSPDPPELERALRMATRAVELDPYLASGQVSLGLVRTEMGELDAAGEAFDTALRLNPASALIHSGLGQLYEAQGELENAELAYLRALEIRPRSWALLIQLGTLYFQQSRLDEAASAFAESLLEAPGNPYGVAGLAGVHFMAGRLDEAAAELQRGIEVRPHAMLYTNLGNIFYYQGLYEQAIAPFKRAVELDEGASDPLLWGNLGDAYRWTPGHEKEALAAYRRGVVLLEEQMDGRPEDVKAASRRMLYQARSGECQAALSNAAVLESTEELDANTWFRLVLTYEQCDRRQRALSTLGHALTAGYPTVAIERERELDRLRADPGYAKLQE